MQRLLASLLGQIGRETGIWVRVARGISLPAPARLPQPLPADRVAGLLNRAGGPAARQPGWPSPWSPSTP